LGLHYRSTAASTFGAEGGRSDNGSSLHSKTYKA
jgi:hypothetical protein